MRKYTVIHTPTGKTTHSDFDSITGANQMAHDLGQNFQAVQWLGFGGVPCVNVVMSEIDGQEQVETVCAYESTASTIAKQMNEERAGKYFVRKILINCQYPHGGDNVPTT